MAEVLSQSQIDALINSMISGESEKQEEVKEERKYKKYDFYSPKKFTKDKLKMLTSVYENYARLCSSRLNSLVRMSTQVDILDVEEQRYYEFSNALNDNDVLTLINVTLPDGSINGPVILHGTNQLILCVIDRMLGGTGEDIAEIPSSYNYTDIELALYQHVVKYLVAVMKDGWSNYMELYFNIDKIETNPGMMQRIGFDETVVIVVMDVDIGGITGKINICLPGSFLSNIFKILEEQEEKLGQEEEIANNIMEGIKETSMEIKAELGSSRLLLRDLFGLQVGDVINLNKSKDYDVYLYIEGEPWCKGELGKSNKNMAVKINEICEKM